MSGAIYRPYFIPKTDIDFVSLGTFTLQEVLGIKHDHNGVIASIQRDHFMLNDNSDDIIRQYDRAIESEQRSLKLFRTKSFIKSCFFSPIMAAAGALTAHLTHITSKKIAAVVGAALGIIASILTSPYSRKSEDSIHNRVALAAQMERNWMRLALAQVNKKLKECQKELTNIKPEEWEKSGKKNGFINQRDSLLALKTYFEKVLLPFQSEVIPIKSEDVSVKQKLLGK